MNILRKSLLILFALFAFGQSAWAQTNVNNADDLVVAVGTDNANIVLEADIQLSSFLNIDAKTVTIDLKGHRLYRSIEGDHASDGHVIYLNNNAHLTLTSSTGTGCIEGGKALNGGAIFIVQGSTLSATNVTFQNNSASQHAGAIWNAGTLTLTNCNISNNTAGDVGGIYNAVVEAQPNNFYGTATLTNCTLSSNTSSTSAGALANAIGGTETTLDSCTFTNNTAATNGGAIWNGGTLTINNSSITGNTCGDSYNGGGIYHVGTALKMKNYIVVRDNQKGSSQNNVYLDSGQVITLLAGFDNGSRIGLTACNVEQTLTNGYPYNNLTSHPDRFFFSDNYYKIVYTDNYEVTFDTNTFVVVANYIDVNGTEQTIWSCRRLSDVIPYGQNDANLYEGWYVVNEDMTYDNRLVVNGDVKLILADGKTLNVNTGLTVNKGNAITIYGQSGQTGQLNATAEYSAGIGSQMGFYMGNITINGGVIVAQGGRFSAAIGGGNRVGPSTNPQPEGVIIINGGTITATGGEDGAGIGGAMYNTPESITINGGTITATGNHYCPAIGCGMYSTTTQITINGGTINAGSGYAGIGRSYGSNPSNITLNWTSPTDSYYASSYDGTVTLEKDFNNEYTILNAGPVENNGVLGNKTLVPPLSRNTFITAGDWNDATHWNTGTVPGSSDNAYVFAAATITNLVEANNIKVGTNGSITIAEGGQLIHSNTGVRATVQKGINPYTVSQTGGGNLSDGWYFIASPVTDAYTPAGSMVENTYDLYRLNPTSEKWENFKNATDHPDFTTLNNGAGYLYANSNLVTLSFTGELKPYSEANGANQVSFSAGWNLVGNPFACNVYASQPFYKMNEARTGLSAELPISTPIAPCEGIIVKASAAGYVTFTKNVPQQNANQGNIRIALAEATNTRSAATALDNAIVSFNEGSQLGKFYFGEQNANIYLPQGGEEYAIAYSDKQGEMPLNFKANADGQYTISVNPEGVEMGYLHLIDNMTGADVDLLHPETVIAGEDPQSPAPSYTFTAKTTDYESRFKLVFVCGDANGDNDGDNEAFAFISNGNIIVNGEGTLQVIDVTGRVLYTAEANSAFCIHHSACPTGVYVLRLINGDDVKTQKIVVR